jgi:uncharacterized membrane protein YjfL (UPF0719 family)
MTTGELFLLMIGLSGTALGMIFWYRPLFGIRSFTLPAMVRFGLFLLPLVSVLIIISILSAFAAAEVRQNLKYLLLFVLLGLAWCFALVLMMPLFGLNYRADALHGGNLSVATVATGLMVGTAFLFAGSNIGEGETVWSTVIPAIVATAVFLLSWAIIEIIAKPFEAITLERDQTSAVRLAGAHVANGIILGRAMAGDYVTAADTARDFVATSWPVLAIVSATIVLQRWLSPQKSKAESPDVFRTGVLPAVSTIGCAIVWVISVGPW